MPLLEPSLSSISLGWVTGCASIVADQSEFDTNRLWISRQSLSLPSLWQSLTMVPNVCLSTILLLVCISLVNSQSSLGSCDYQKFPANGCEDELGADCDSSSMECRCKSGNWFVIDQRFCFPTQCPKGQYYDHNLLRCENQRKASLNSEENYCRHNFHCKGNDLNLIIKSLLICLNDHRLRT